MIIDSFSHLKNTWVMAILVAISLFLFVSILSMSILFAYGLFYVHTLTQATNGDMGEIITQVRTGLHTHPQQHQDIKTILILGTDQVANRDQDVILTDTIMLLNIHFTSGKITTISLPRDIWSDAYQTKINGLYHYGKTFYPDKPEQFPQEVLSELTGIPIHHTVVISLDMLGELITLVHGIPVFVERGFTDTKFPRDDVDITSGNPDELYKTVVFTPGLENMDSDRALTFIRSRNSEDDEGTDIARAMRQQQVVKSLLAQLTSPQIVLRPNTIAQLYNWYTAHYQAVFPISEIVATTIHLFPHRNAIQFVQHTPSIYPENPNGVLEHPNPALYQNLWVYRVRDTAAFSQELQTIIGITP